MNDIVNLIALALWGYVIGQALCLILPALEGPLQRLYATPVMRPFGVIFEWLVARFEQMWRTLVEAFEWLITTAAKAVTR